MKIQRAETKSFAISERAERKWKKKLRRGFIKRFINRLIFKEETKFVSSYRLLAKFKVSRIEEIHKGMVGEQTVYETKENYFYVDLSNLDFYMIHGHSIEKTDVLQKIVNLPDASVRLLGELLKKSYVYTEKLDRNSLLDLAHLGYTEMYKSTTLNLFKGLWDELNPEEMHKTVVKERIKTTVHLPRFDDKCYDLSLSLIETDVIDDTYSKDNIKHSIDALSHLLTTLFDAKIILKGIVFMPYLTAVYERVGQHKIKSPERHFPVCFIHDFRVKQKEGVKLKPISLSTSISVAGSVPIQESAIDFSDIGGLEEVKKEIRETILSPMVNPEFAKQIGKKCGGAILLYGPPGCGKTHIAKATIGEIGLPFFNVNISEIVNKGVQSEAGSLHKIFEEARRNAPSILFFDELDAIGGCRGGTMDYTEKMEVDQFLMEMDGVESLGREVLIIAATNTPWNIDPALRRSERFTKQIFVPPPDLDAREKIFRIHLRDKPLEKDVDLAKLAKLTKGYSSSDIKAICDRAVDILWGEAMKGDAERKIQMTDFEQAIKKQKPSLIPWFKLAHKELRSSGEEKLFGEFSKYILKYGGGVDQVEKPGLNFSDVGGMEQVKEEIKKLIIYPLTNPELSKEFKKEVGGSLLLYGPPGCGKTYIARATAGECDVAFFNIRLTDILSDKTGESEKNIQEIFERANRNTPAILFFDEIDAIAGRRDKDNTELGKRLIDAFLTEMDGFKKTKGLVIIAATNTPWNIDPALRRAGRFTKQIFVPPPDLDAREQIFKIHIRDKPISPGVNFNKLTSLTYGYASSDIKAICDLAVELPWEEALKGGKDRKVELRDFITVIQSYKTSLSSWYCSAEKQITESGEGDLYAELMNNMKEFKENVLMSSEDGFREIMEEEKTRLGMRSKSERADIEKLILSKDEIEEKIKVVRSRYYNRQLDEDMFREILVGYEKQLVETDVKLEILRDRGVNAERDKISPETQERLEGGQIYLIKEKKPRKCIELFLYETDTYPGLWISRTNPDELKTTYGPNTENTSLLWLTESLTYDGSISPQIPQLFARLMDFIAGSERKIILLDGIEYLISHNGFDSTLNFIQGMKDKISVSNAMMLITVIPEVFSERELILIEKECRFCPISVCTVP